MRIVRILLVGGLLVTAFAVVSCEEPPHQAVSRVRVAYGDLRDRLEAGRWAPDEFAAAEAAVRSAEKEMATQQGRLPFMRDFARTQHLFAEALADVTLARSAAESARSEIERQAREAMEAAASAVSHARAARMIAPVSRSSRSAYSRLDRDLDRAEADLVQVRNLIVAQKHQEALGRAEQILEEITSLVRAVGREARR